MEFPFDLLLKKSSYHYSTMSPSPFLIAVNVLYGELEMRNILSYYNGWLKE